MTIDRDRFFGLARGNPFSGRMTQDQVDGCNAILDGWEARPDFTDRRWLAYMLATAKWETAHTMQPIEEYGKGRGHSYGAADPGTGQASPASACRSTSVRASTIPTTRGGSSTASTAPSRSR